MIGARSISDALLGRLSIRSRLTIWYSLVLLVILVLVGGLSYSLLRTRLLHDVDASLLAVAQGIQGATPPTGDAGPESLAEWARAFLGPEMYESLFQFSDPEGHVVPRPPGLRDSPLPLSPAARRNAAAGQSTLETVDLPRQGPTRLLTIPVIRQMQVIQLVQIGLPLERTRQTLASYLRTLVLVIPAGVVLAALGGATLARAALRPVDAMSATARRITAEDLAQRVALRGSGDELDRLAQTLNAMLGRLEATFAQMRRFAADAAHELRTPLTALQGTIEVALRAERNPAEYRRVLASSLEDIARLRRVAEDLLLLSRATAGLDVPRQIVELEPIALEVVDLGIQLGQRAGVTVRVKELAPLAVRGDAVALRRALTNLVENAIKYTPPGGAVEVALGRAGDSAIVSVTDTGIGIAPADRERIFEPFVRLDPARARDTGGTGLGLAIARSIATAHGGTIRVESAPGAGSRFTLRVPMAHPVSPA